MNGEGPDLLRRTALVTLARIALLGCWFGAMVLSYRLIGARPDGLVQAGLLSLGLTGVKIFATALSDPLDMDVVRRVPTLIGPRPDEAAKVWRAAQQIRLGLMALLLLAALLLAEPIARAFTVSERGAAVVRLAGLAAALELVFRGHLSDWQSRERFTPFLLLEAMLQLCRIGGIVVVALTLGLGAFGFLVAYAAATGATLAVALLITDPARRALWRIDPGALRESFDYLRWVAPALLLASFVERLDLLMLGRIGGAAEAGLYGALLPLILVPEAVAGFAIHALQPRIAAIRAEGGVLRFWGGLMRVTLPLSIALAVGVVLLAPWVIEWTIGPSFLPAVPAFRLLFTTVILWVGIIPVPMSVVVMTQPRATLTITILQAVVVAGVGLALIPSHGAVGAGLAYLAMRASAGAMICVAALWAERVAPA